MHPNQRCKEDISSKFMGQKWQNELEHIKCGLEDIGSILLIFTAEESKLGQPGWRANDDNKVFILIQ